MANEDYIRFRISLETPVPLPVPPVGNLATAWHAPPDDAEWPTPATEDDARALLERLGTEQADVCIHAGMVELMRAESTESCLVAAVGNDRMDRVMQQMADLARSYVEACGRADFYPRWWRRCRCRLAFADAPSVQLEWESRPRPPLSP